MCTPEYEKRERSRIVRQKLDRLSELHERGNVAQASADAIKQEISEINTEIEDALVNQSGSLHHQLATV